ncbi:MAG: hypothetical protein ACKPB9_21625, partial [Dolichospermum sp.]
MLQRVVYLNFVWYYALSGINSIKSIDLVYFEATAIFLVFVAKSNEENHLNIMRYNQLGASDLKVSE